MRKSISILILYIFFYQPALSYPDDENMSTAESKELYAVVDSIKLEVEEIKDGQKLFNDAQEHLVSINSLIFGGVAALVSIGTIIFALLRIVMSRHEALRAKQHKDLENKILNENWEAILERLDWMADSIIHGNSDQDLHAKEVYKSSLKALSTDALKVQSGFQHLLQVSVRSITNLAQIVRNHWERVRDETADDERRLKAETTLRAIDRVISLYSNSNTT